MAKQNDFDLSRFDDPKGLDTFRNFVLPGLAVLETIATSLASRGTNVGTTSLKQIESLQKEKGIRDIGREKALQRALDQQFKEDQGRRADKTLGLTEESLRFKQSQAKQKSEAEEKAAAREAARRNAIIRDAQRINLLPEEEQEGAARQLFAQVDPKGFSSKMSGLGGPDLTKAIEMLIMKEGLKTKSQTLKPTAEEQKGLGAVGPAVEDLNDLVHQFKTKDISGAKNVGKGLKAKVPLAGKFLAPDAATFNQKKRVVSERFLRAATGAAAPAHEVRTYMGFLPDVGDPQDIAQNKLDVFKQNVKAKATQHTSRLRLQGFVQEADIIENRIDEMLATVDNIIDGKAATSSGFEIEEQ